MAVIFGKRQLHDEALGHAFDPTTNVEHSLLEDGEGMEALIKMDVYGASGCS